MAQKEPSQVMDVENVDVFGRPIDERRAELIQQRVLGVELRDIVKALSAKYRCSPKTIYQDWRLRRKWGPRLVGMEDGDSLTVDIVALLNWLKRRAVMEVMQGDNSAARIGAIKAVKDVARDIYDIAKETGKIKIVPEEMKLRLELSGLGKSPFMKDDSKDDGKSTGP